MDTKAARRLGGGISIQTLLLPVILFELFALIKETEGDFANGILFYLQDQLNPFALGGFAILFTTTYIWGRTAGSEILVMERNFVWVGVKYTALTLVIFLGYIVGMYAAKNALGSAWETLLPALIIISISLLITGILSAWRIKRKARDDRSVNP